jgi:hypothetical protein
MAGLFKAVPKLQFPEHLSTEFFMPRQSGGKIVAGETTEIVIICKQ